jgi:hypothetical protein
MSTAIRELPDCESLIVKHLQADSGLKTAGLKQVAGPESPKTPRWPMIRVHRFGGTAPFAPWLDGGIFQVDVWGREDTTELRSIAAKVRVSLQEMVGVHDQGVVTGVEEITGPAYLPDPGTGRPRVTWSVRVTAHPNP